MINDVVIKAGDTMSLQITLKDISGKAVNLTGSTIKWALAKTDLDVPLLTKSTNNDISITDAVNGAFVININSADTITYYSDKQMYHEARVHLANGSISTVFYGKFTIAPSLSTTI